MNQFRSERLFGFVPPRLGFGSGHAAWLARDNHGRGAWQVYSDKPSLWIKVVRARFVDHAHHPVSRRFGVFNNPIDFAWLQRSRITIVADTHRKRRGRLWTRHGYCLLARHVHCPRNRLTFISFRPMPCASYQPTHLDHVLDRHPRQPATNVLLEVLGIPLLSGGELRLMPGLRAALLTAQTRSLHQNRDRLPAIRRVLPTPLRSPRLCVALRMTERISNAEARRAQS